MNTRKAIAILAVVAFPFAATTALIAPSVAFAAPEAAEIQADPVSFEGTFQRFLLTPDGRIEGMQLTSGTTVRIPARAFQQGAESIRPGNTVHVEGKALKTKTGTVVVRAMIQQAGRIVADARNLQHRPGDKGHDQKAAPSHPHANLAPMQATAKVSALVSNRRGHVDMLLLDDGTTVSAHHLDGLGLKPGDQVTVDGRGGAYQLGKAMRARSIRLPNGETRQVGGGRHHHGPPQQPPA